jgi:GNAT superfamily N-acetyltransferase
MRPRDQMTFTVDRLRAGDVRAAAELHHAAFPNFFLSKLGTPFLVQFYCGFLDDSTAITVVARDHDGRVRGVAVGTVEPAVFFRRLLHKRWAGFVLASGRAAFRDPSKLPRLLRAAQYRGGETNGSGGALLSSICVDPANQGVGIGKLLMDTWVQEVATRKVGTAFLTTDAVGNAPVNQFYRTHGWRLSDSFTTREGRPMNRYELSVDGYTCLR